MCKTSLREAQMSDATYIDEVTSWARWLTLREARGPGDMPNAWVRLERRYGVPARIFWALRYRPPKTLSVGIYARIKHARDAERERQLRLLKHDIEITKATAGSDQDSIRSALAIVDENNSGEAK